MLSPLRKTFIRRLRRPKQVRRQKHALRRKDRLSIVEPLEDRRLLTTWTQLGSDIDGQAAFEASGNSVAASVDGNRVVVGAYRRDLSGNGEQNGQVRVYDLDGGSWSQVGGAIVGNGGVKDEFGTSVAASSDGHRVVIGAPQILTAENGYVGVYDWNGSSWTQVGGDIVGEAQADWSGYSVAASSDGSRVVIGAPWNDGNGNLSGQVRVYDLLDGAWTQVGNDIDGEAVSDQFGSAVAVSSDGSRVVIGAQYSDGDDTFDSKRGHVRVYDLVGSNWNQVGSDIDGKGVGNRFGFSVAASVDGNRFVSGSPNYGTNRGQVRAFDWDGSSWNQVGGDIDGETAQDQSGASVAVSGNGNRVVIGAPLDDGVGQNSGQVRVYRLNDDSNTPPEAEDDSYVTDEDTPLVVDAPGVLANDSDDDEDALTVIVDSNPSNGTLVLEADGGFIYTPDANFNGSDSFTYIVDDGNGGTDTATVNITVNSVIDAVVDVKPGNGDEVDPINLGGKGRIPIAILATQQANGDIDDFDPTSIDLDTTSFQINGQDIEADKIRLEDVDGDGDLDLLLHFLTEDLAEILAEDSTELLLTAEFGGDALGQDLGGSDEIKIVPGEGKGKKK